MCIGARATHPRKKTDRLPQVQPDFFFHRAAADNVPNRQRTPYVSDTLYPSGRGNLNPLRLVHVVIGALGAYTVAANYAQLIRQTNATGVFYHCQPDKEEDEEDRGRSSFAKKLDTLGSSSDYQLGAQKAGAARIHWKSGQVAHC